MKMRIVIHAIMPEADGETKRVFVEAVVAMFRGMFPIAHEYPHGEEYKPPVTVVFEEDNDGNS